MCYRALMSINWKLSMTGLNRQHCLGCSKFHFAFSHFTPSREVNVKSKMVLEKMYLEADCLTKVTENSH